MWINNSYNKGQSLIGIIIVLVIAGLLGGSLYFYFQKQIPESLPGMGKQEEEEEPTVGEQEAESPGEQEEVVVGEQEEEEEPNGSCQDECPRTGVKRCFSNGYQTCGNYDDDKCLEWSSIISCSVNTICQNGNCIQQKCVDGTNNNECSFFNKPKFCENGNLIDSCSECGCQPGRICKENKCVGKVWNLIASNNPVDYLSDYINVEIYSDWKYYQPIVNKVNELISSLTNDNDKAEVIADWVRNSKTYDELALIANSHEATMIDIFNSDKGVCLDASMLATAMLRLANIPARSVFPATGIWHAYTEAYINGGWVGIDATFGPGPGGAVFYSDLTAVLYTSLQTPSNNLFVKSKSLSRDAEERYIIDNNGEEYNFEKVNYYETKVIPRNNYGYIYYPITKELAACNFEDKPPWICNEHSLEFDESHRAHDYLQNIFVSKDKECSYYYCEEISDSQNLSMSVPGSKYKGYYIEHPLQKIPEVVAYNEPCWDYAYVKKFGYIKTALPPGKYMIKYWGGNSGGIEKPVAYYDFEVENGKTIIIKPNMLEKWPDCDSNKFNVFIELLKRSVDGVVVE